MAKAKHRKPAKGGTKRRKKSTGSSGWVVKLFALIVVLLLGLIIFYLIYTAKSSRQDSRAEQSHPAVIRQQPSSADDSSVPVAGPIESEPVPRDSESVPAVALVHQLRQIDYERTAQPELIHAYSSQLIDHTAYRLSYNADYKVANWVFYELTRAETEVRLKRVDSFKPDPKLSAHEAAQLSDYRKSGYDRGHLAPSADMNWDSDVMRESFYLSNMCPQKHRFNAGVWLDLENQVREWAQRDSAVCVVAGPVLPRDKRVPVQTIGQNRVYVPEFFYKVVLSPFGQHPKAIGFVMPHAADKKDCSAYAVSVDSVERLTQIDFFSILPDEVEDEVESVFDHADWF